VRTVLQMTLESESLATVVDSAFVTFQTLRRITRGYSVSAAYPFIYHWRNMVGVLATSPENAKSHVKYIL